VPAIAAPSAVSECRTPRPSRRVSINDASRTPLSWEALTQDYWNPEFWFLTS
jgi:hypothetical protein